MLESCTQNYLLSSCIIKIIIKRRGSDSNWACCSQTLLSFVFQLEKKRQLETQRVHTFQLMLEKEQSYVDKLRSELAKAGTSSSTNVTAMQAELAGAERRVRTLQEQLAAISTTNEQVCIFIFFLYIYLYRFTRFFNNLIPHMHYQNSLSPNLSENLNIKLKDAIILET